MVAVNVISSWQLSFSGHFNTHNSFFLSLLQARKRCKVRCLCFTPISHFVFPGVLKKASLFFSPPSPCPHTALLQHLFPTNEEQMFESRRKMESSFYEGISFRIIFSGLKKRPLPSLLTCTTQSSLACVRWSVCKVLSQTGPLLLKLFFFCYYNVWVYVWLWIAGLSHCGTVWNMTVSSTELFKQRQETRLAGG